MSSHNGEKKETRGKRQGRSEDRLYLWVPPGMLLSKALRGWRPRGIFGAASFERPPGNGRSTLGFGRALGSPALPLGRTQLIARAPKRRPRSCSRPKDKLEVIIQVRAAHCRPPERPLALCVTGHASQEKYRSAASGGTNLADFGQNAAALGPTFHKFTRSCWNSVNKLSFLCRIWCTPDKMRSFPCHPWSKLFEFGSDLAEFGPKQMELGRRPSRIGRSRPTC